MIRSLLAFILTTVVIVSLIWFFDRPPTQEPVAQPIFTPQPEAKIPQEDANLARQENPVPIKNNPDIEPIKFEKIYLLRTDSRLHVLQVYRASVKAKFTYCPENAVLALLKNSTVNPDGNIVSFPGCFFEQDGRGVFRYFDLHAGGPRDFSFDNLKYFESTEDAENQAWRENLLNFYPYQSLIDHNIEETKRICEGYKIAKNIDIYEFCMRKIEKKTDLLSELSKWGFIDFESAQLCHHATNFDVNTLPACFIAAFEMCRESLTGPSNINKCLEVFTNGQWLSNPKARMHL